MRRFAALVLLVCFAVPVLSDMASVPYRRVRIFEPKQRAMIAWNGEEEILVLSTDLKASAPSKVLEIMPLPSEPHIKKGDIGIFKRAVDIINRRRQLGHGGSFDASSSTPSRQAPPPARVTFHEKIGAHDVSTIELVDEKGFVSWCEGYLRKQNAEVVEIPGPLKKVVGEYIKDGYKWFVFDVISLTEEEKTKDALEFRFKTDLLYYPLRITKTEIGFTDVEVIVLTEKLLHSSMMRGIPRKMVKLRHKPIDISSRELKEISEDMYELLGKPESSSLRILHIRDQLSNFKQDLLIGYRGLMLEFSKLYPAKLKGLVIFGEDSSHEYLCYVNKSAGVYVFDSKSKKLRFLQGVKGFKANEVLGVTSSSPGKFRINLYLKNPVRFTVDEGVK